MGLGPGTTTTPQTINAAPNLVSCDTSSTPVTLTNSDGVTIPICQSFSVSDSTENNSDINWSGITKTQIDDKIVKLTLPFKSDLSIERTVPGDSELTSEDVRRVTKVFLNIYPIEP